MTVAEDSTRALGNYAVALMIGFSFTGTVAILLYVLGALVLVGSFISQQYKLLGWFRNRRSGDTPPQQPAPTKWWRPPLAADQRVVELIPTGGGSAVDFRAELANYGTQQCRCMITAR